jgi:hypothetical protein
MAKELEFNPFEIKTDIEYSGQRQNQAMVSALVTQMIKLTIDKKESVNIPLQIADKANNSSNLFNVARKVCEEHKDKTVKNMVFISRAVYSIDGKKTYLRRRIWRIK